MRQFTKTLFTFSVLVLLVFGLYFFADWFSKTTGYVLGEDEKIVLAQCLEGKDAVFYTSSTCPACEVQEEIFGKGAWRFIEVVECQNPEDCPEGGVPAWEVSGKIHYGFKTFEELIKLSGCKVVEP